MEVAIELLWEDKLAHPQWPHVFVVPRFMTHMWRRDLGKSTDILFTVPAGVPFWGASQFEPLKFAIIFPRSHVSSYTGPWAVKGTDLGEHFQRALQEGFKRPGAGSSPNGSRVAESGSGGPKSPPETLRGIAREDSGLSTAALEDPSQLHVMDGPLFGVFSDPEGGHGLFCGNYLLARGNYPPCRSVWCGECYRESPNDNFPRLDHLQSGSDLEVDAAYTQSCYRCGRNGFECDLCSFRNVVGRDQDVTDARDEFTLTAIR
jgi:hypothetical protein